MLPDPGTLVLARHGRCHVCAQADQRPEAGEARILRHACSAASRRSHAAGNGRVSFRPGRLESLVRCRGIKAALLGNSGSGKSTLAARLARQPGLDPSRVLDLDTIYWDPGQIAVARDAKRVLHDLRRFCEAGDAWIVEGCYADLVQCVLPYGPQLLFLDPGADRCVQNCLARPWQPHKYASKAEQDPRLVFLLDWARAYYTREGSMSWAAHQALFDAYTGPKRRITGR